MAGTIRRALRRSRLASEYYIRSSHERQEEIEATQNCDQAEVISSKAEATEARYANEAEHKDKGG